MQCIEPPARVGCKSLAGWAGLLRPPFLPPSLAAASSPAPNFVAFRSTFIWQEEPHSLVHVNHFWQPTAQPENTHIHLGLALALTLIVALILTTHSSLRSFSCAFDWQLSCCTLINIFSIHSFLKWKSNGCRILNGYTHSPPPADDPLAFNYTLWLINYAAYYYYNNRLNIGTTQLLTKRVNTHA